MATNGVDEPPTATPRHARFESETTNGHARQDLEDTTNPYFPKLYSEDPQSGYAHNYSSHRQNSLNQKRRPLVAAARTKSDFGPNSRREIRDHEEEEDSQDEHDNGARVKDAPPMRHGWETQLTSEEQAAALSQNFFMYWTDKRQDSAARIKVTPNDIEDWRMRDRLKTVGALLAVCLNIGVDPPDVVKTDPCARMECWIDPISDVPQGQGTAGVTTAVGKALQAQFESMSMRTRYKLAMDPSVDDLKKFCAALRKSSRDERLLFHYNGHGVPKPTPAGEIWVFNRSFTQYIPVSLFDLQSWLGPPGLFLWDCSSAGLIIKNFHNMAQKHESEQQEARKEDPSLPLLNYMDSIHLAACREKEVLPANPDLPADLFTSCLTTPIDTALRYFLLQNPLPGGLSLEEGRNIPGKISERRTPLGELNWIFTAITDTIAWNSLSKPLFKKLFRQDLMVAALFRNFLLAQRVMRTYHCRPQSYPNIPDTHNDPLWDCWDYAVEMILKQLPSLRLLSREQQELSYKHSDFFADQLSAFETYLAHGALDKKMPEQLPIVLQVLLSQVHRLRALILLSKFLDLGTWAVNLALSIGIFPYVLKLLQSQAQELKQVMIFIWARILALDQSCQSDLLKDNGYQYFVSMSNPQLSMPTCPNPAEHRAMCAFIIAMFCKDFRAGQHVCLNTNPEIIDYMLYHINDRDEPLLRQYACLCLSMLWKDYQDAKWAAIRSSAPIALGNLWSDPSPEVRTAAVNALTNFIGIPGMTEQVVEIESKVAEAILPLADDGNIMVRKEYIVFLSVFVHRYRGRFIVAAWEEMIKQRKDQLPSQVDESFPLSRQQSHSSSDTHDADQNGVELSITKRTIFLTLWQQVLILTADAHPEIAENAATILDSVLQGLFSSPLGASALKIVDAIVEYERHTANAVANGLEIAKQNGRDPMVTSPSINGSPSTRSEGYFSAGLRRTASMAASIKNLAAFGAAKERAAQVAQVANNDSLQSSVSSIHSLTSPQRGARQNVPKEWKLPADALDPSPSPLRVYAEAMQPHVIGYTPRDFSVSPVIPIPSTFVAFSMSYFREPQLRQNESDEPGSKDFNERIWRRSRNDRVIGSTQPLKDLAVTGRWNVPAGVLSDTAPVSKVVFHQFEPRLLTADDRDTVSIWDWHTSTRIGRWSNGNPRGSKITDARFVNEDDIALVMTGSSDGVVRLFRNYDSKKKIELATTFRALTDMIPSTINVGLVSEWQQGQGRLLVAGDVRVIRVWSAATELCVSDIPARSSSNVTCLTSDQVEGNVLVAGFGDGAVRVYDLRNRPNESMVKAYREHKGWVVGAHMQRGGMRELISAERGGAVRLWDIRMDRSVGVVKGKGEHGVGTLRSLSVHEHAPVFAAGSSHNALRVFATNNITTHAEDSPAPLSTIEPFSSMLSSSHNRAAPVVAAAFHPHRMMLACSVLGDGNVSLFKCVGRHSREIEDGMELGGGKSGGVVREWHGQSQQQGQNQQEHAYGASGGLGSVGSR